MRDAKERRGTDHDPGSEQKTVSPDAVRHELWHPSLGLD